MTVPTPIHCPACGYDLSAAKDPAGACPECGYRFDAGALDAREHAEVSLALALVAWGTLGALVASAIGQSFVYLPRANEGSAGSSSAAAVIRLPLLLGVAYGVFALSGLTGKSAPARRWPMVVACIFAVSAVVRISPNARWGSDMYPRWLQPSIYGTIAEWAYMFAQGLVIIAGAVVARRLVARLGAARLRGWVIFVAAAGGALMLLDLLGRVHSAYALPYSGVGPFANPGSPAPPPQPAFVQTRLFTTTIGFVEGATWWLASGALGFLALHLRTLWRVAGRGTSEGCRWLDETQEGRT